MFFQYATYCLIIKSRKRSNFLVQSFEFFLKWSQVNKLSNNIDHVVWKQSFVVIWNNCADGSVDNLIWHNKQIPGISRIENISLVKQERIYLCNIKYERREYPCIALEFELFLGLRLVGNIVSKRWVLPQNGYKSRY